MKISKLLVSILLFACVLFSACTPAATQASPPTLILPTATSIPPDLTATAALKVTSTLDGLTTLPHRIQWEAKPADPNHQVTGVTFLIDSQVAWVEHKAPYFYGDDDNYLVTSFLTPGEHSFTVRVFTIKSQTIESTVKTTVVAEPTPPDGLANTSWTRYQTAADVAKATSDLPGHPGQIGLTIDSVGWMFHDPDGGGLLIDVGYQSDEEVELRAAIEKPPYPNQYGGAFCAEPDPPILWSYTLSNGGKTLTLHPVTSDPCGDRLGAFEGTWTSAGN